MHTWGRPNATAALTLTPRLPSPLPRAGKPEQLREVEAKQRDLEEQERQVTGWLGVVTVASRRPGPLAWQAPAYPSCLPLFHPFLPLTPCCTCPVLHLPTLPQMYEALRSLGHVFQAPRRDPATGAALERSASTGGLSRAASSSTAAPATAEAFWEALKRVDEVAPHVPHSELLLAAKAEGLLRLGKHERVREFCSQVGGPGGGCKGGPR